MENEAKELQVHIVYAVNYYHYFDDTLRSFILEGMRKFKIRSVMVTKIFMWRSHLITKEKTENLYKGDRDSVNNNLESLIMIHYFKIFDLQETRMTGSIGHIFYRN